MQNITHPSGRSDRQNQGSTLKCEGMRLSNKNSSQVHWQLRGVYSNNEEIKQRESRSWYFSLWNSNTIYGLPVMINSGHIIK